MVKAARRKSLWIGIALLGMSCAEGGPLHLPDTRETTIPADVAQFVSRRNTCDRWRAMPDDPATREMREARVAQHCVGSDEQLSRLLAKYPANAEVQGILGFYEPIGE